MGRNSRTAMPVYETVVKEKGHEEHNEKEKKERDIGNIGRR